MKTQVSGPVVASRSRPFVLKVSVASLVAVGVLTGASVWAQEVAPVTPTDGPVVTVTGVRKAAQSSQMIKQNAEGVVDSIVADDIGKFPDNNVAETLARVTGIQIRRDSSEANSVLIRGLPGVATLLNGRELFTTTGRFVQLADIPSTMLQRVDVYKSQGADLVEGGIAGVIDVRTNRPLDFKGYTVTANAGVNHSDKSKANDPNASAMISNRWKTDAGEFGALLGLSYQDRNYHEERAFNTAPVDKSWLLPKLTGPDLVGLIPIKGDRKRTAANAALQWRPNSDVEIYAEGMSSHLKADSEIDFFVGLPWWGDGALMKATKIPGTDQMQTLESHNVNTITSTQATRVDSLTNQFALGGRWDASSQLRLTSEIAMTTSKYDWQNPILDTVINVPNAYVNTNLNGSTYMNYTGKDMTDPKNYYLKGFFDRYGRDEGSSTDLRVDGIYSIDGKGFFKEFSGGVRIADRSAESIKSYEGNVEGPDINAGAWPASRQNAATVNGLSCLSEPMSGNYGMKQWYTPCASFLLNNTAVIRKAITGTDAARALDPGSFFKDVEKTYAAYAKAKIGFDLGSVPVDGTLGLRLVRTDQTLQGNSSQNNAYTLTTKNTSDTDALPSLALKFKLRSDLVGRFTAGKTLTRPDFSQLNPGVALVNSSETVKATGSGGNPDLKPVTGKNVDASLEWYFAPTGSMTGSVFSHKFDGYILGRATPEKFGSITYDVTRPYNTGTGHLEGIEIAYQQFFDKLPGWLSGFGLQANATFMKGETTDPSGTVAFPGLSKSAYNIVALYEKNDISARLAYNWRSKFVDTYNQGGAGFDLIVAPTSQLDGSISYKIDSNLSVTLFGNNLLDAKFKDYWKDANLYPRDTRSYDRTIGLALRWKN